MIWRLSNPRLNSYKTNTTGIYDYCTRVLASTGGRQIKDSEGFAEEHENRSSESSAPLNEGRMHTQIIAPTIRLQELSLRSLAYAPGLFEAARAIICVTPISQEQGY
jgi:hypothetical protein